MPVRLPSRPPSSDFPGLGKLQQTVDNILARLPEKTVRTEAQMRALIREVVLDVLEEKGLI